ncbi:unnamed protein product [Lactuca virosa]|uniref:LIM-domain binding protein/SEUSS n=1 Tax=Lactuca virosa TaxID=75947 RepID=A0AAU9P6C0_9ASTR|nr:unnamed protein product [Lactuca virosa]
MSESDVSDISSETKRHNYLSLDPILTPFSSIATTLPHQFKDNFIKAEHFNSKSSPILYPLRGIIGNPSSDLPSLIHCITVDNYLDSSQELALPTMGPSRTGGGMLHSSSTSGIFFQDNMQSQLGSFGNMSNPMHPNVSHSHISADISNNPMNSITTSAPSIGASSMVTDANSGLSVGPHLQRSASFNTDSYTRLPTSPLSFSSNNLSISGSSIIDGVQNSNQDPHSHQMQKKPRLDIKQDDIIQQHQVVQQILQNPNPNPNPNQNPQLQALIQQQRIRQQQQQQQQLLQSLPPLQRAHLLQQQQLRQLQVQQQASVKRPNDGGVCSRRLMQYLYHQRQRPSDNSIAYWRKFVAEYYSPRAKKRWCLSLYENVGHHSLGVFPQASLDTWQCDICGSKSGRGFEATFEVLPRLNEIKFSSGVIDELLFLDLPRESRFPSGIMMLEYGKAVQESVYEQLRVVRQGQLKVIFTPDLKILTWEFCARRHEELLPRRIVAPQVNQLLQVAQKCQSTVSEGGSDGVSQQDLQTNSNMVVTAWRQLARSLELQSLNDLGFSKRYVRCLQISEVVSSMKDLMDFCQDNKVGPIEGLKSYPRQVSMGSAKVEMGQVSSQMVNNRGPGALLSGSPQSALTLTNYQNMLMRQKSMNSNSPNNGSLQDWGLQNNRISGGFHHQPPPSQGGNQAAQHHMIQQLLQDMNNNNGAGGGGGGGPVPGPKPTVSGQSGGGGSMRYGGGGGGGVTRSNSFKGGSHSDSSAGGGNIGVSSQKGGVLDIVEDIGSEFNENGFFNNDDFEF